MFGLNTEETFLNDPTRARLRGGEGRSWSLLLVFVAGLGAFGAWAWLFEIEEVTRGTGRVVPSQQIQVVQSLEPGIVRAIEVRAGDQVEAGQVLMLIDDTEVQSSRGELLQQEAALLAEDIRLQAEVAMNRAPDYPQELRARAPNAVLAELDVLEARFAQLDGEIAVLQDQLAQRRAALLELRADRERQVQVRAPLAEEMVLTEDLVDRGAVPRIDLLRLQSRLAEIDGTLAVSAAQEPNLAAAVQEAENQIGLARTAWVLAARQRLARLTVELAVVQEALRAAEDRVTRKQLVSPIAGTVNRLTVTTLGAVVEPGAPLIEVVPAGDSLEIEVQILPRDVAFIRPGDPVSVKISAYDYLVYGALVGEVVRIGADTILDPEGREVFELIVRTEQTDLGRNGQSWPITPGMTAQVDIQTGTRSVMSYLLQPLLRLQSEALRDS